MYREHVMLEEAPQEVASREEALEPMVKKAAVMAAVDALAAAFFYGMLSYFEVGTPLARGLAVISFIWLGHLESITWRAHAKFAASSGWGRALVSARLWMKSHRGAVAFAALVTLMAAILLPQYPRAGPFVLLFKFGIHVLTWLSVMCVGASWAAMIAPAKLARFEAMPGPRLSRVWAAVKASAPSFALSLAAWVMFCGLERWR